MRKTLTLITAVAALGAAVAGCGSSKASGVALAPSGGATADSSTATTPSSTTSTSTSQTPLPSALNTKPKVVPPKGAPPKKLVVKDLIKGTGPAISSSSQTATVQYVGVLYKNGSQFDASWNDGSGKATPLPLNGVIPGWQKGMIGMKVGGRRELIIPPSLGYGARKQAKIPANSTLEFVIDLHSVSG